MSTTMRAHSRSTTCRAGTAPVSSSATSTSTSTRARSSPCSAPTAPARPRRCSRSRACCRSSRGEVRLLGDAHRPVVAAAHRPPRCRRRSPTTAAVPEADGAREPVACADSTTRSRTRRARHCSPSSQTRLRHTGRAPLRRPAADARHRSCARPSTAAAARRRAQLRAWRRVIVQRLAARRAATSPNERRSACSSSSSTCTSVWRRRPRRTCSATDPSRSPGRQPTCGTTPHCSTRAISAPSTTRNGA